MIGGNKMKKLMPLLFVAILCSGCGDTINDIKEAAAGINSKANEAASAISPDVHSIRAIELTFDNEPITVNDLFKTILRDVQWHYDEVNTQLKVTGTWKNNGLFSELQFTEQQKLDLIENGKVTVLLTFVGNQLLTNDIQVEMKLHQDIILNKQDPNLLQHFYNVYKDSR